MDRNLKTSINDLKRYMKDDHFRVIVENSRRTKAHKYHGKDVKQIRKTLSRFCHYDITQKVFADVTGFSSNIVELWEKGLAEPNQKACHILRDLQSHPKSMLLALQGHGYVK